MVKSLSSLLKLAAKLSPPDSDCKSVSRILGTRRKQGRGGTTTKERERARGRDGEELSDPWRMNEQEKERGE